MGAKIIDGKAFAEKVRGQVAKEVLQLKQSHAITPGLAVVLVGADPASQVYVRSKGKMTTEVGMKSIEHRLDTDTSESDLLTLIDQLNADLPALKEFVLPGGNRPAADCHLARAICRRAERRAIALASVEQVNGESLRYLNRLSDLLFVIARVLVRQNGENEVSWQSTRIQ